MYILANVKKDWSQHLLVVDLSPVSQVIPLPAYIESIRHNGHNLLTANEKS